MKSGTVLVSTAGGLQLPVPLPKVSVFSSPAPDLTGTDFSAFYFTLPPELPPATEITFFAIDHDFLWWQCTRKLRSEITLPLAGPDAAACWQPRQHHRIWHDRTPVQLREWGFQIHPPAGDTRKIHTVLNLRKISLLRRKTLPPIRIEQLSRTPQQPRTGELLEISFRLNRLPCSPFNPEQLKIDCMIGLPNQKQETVRCFYFEDFLYDPEEQDKTRCLTPSGMPKFRMRYTPLLAGTFRTSFRITENGRSQIFAGPSFPVEDSGRPFPGFVRPDPSHPTFLQYDNGSPFLGIGMNVRSPYDNRYREVAPYSLWEDRGLQAYEHLFRRYEDCGINVAEVWMSSWWLALEWIPDSPGFHGVGHYNQYRAWMLDYIFRLAEKHHIYLILVFNNHGKFGMTFDTEWKRNPYNKANDGFLDKCEDYYTSEKARQAFRSTVDYIVARWGYSPRLLMWKLFTEVDLTGPTISFYHHPSVAAWHREMGDYLHKTDLRQRMVTTHWMLGYHRINNAIACLPQLDCLTTDAYYQSGGSRSLVQMLQAGARKARSWQKPLVITEFGGSSYADNMGNLMKQVELGLWTGLFNEYSILPMYWWFALVEDKDLYHYYKAITKYATGEDRRNMKLSSTELSPASGISLVRNEMRKDDRLLLWFYDRNFFHTSRETAEPALIPGFTCQIPDLKKTGSLQIEYWNTSDGTVIKQEKQKISQRQQNISLKLPAFRRSLAVKIFIQK